MNFDVLLEGTMIGAEISALTEAVTVDVSAARNAESEKEFAIALIEPVKKLADDVAKYMQVVKKIALENRKTLHKNAEKLNEAALKKIAPGLERLGLKHPDIDAIVDAHEEVINRAKKVREVALKAKKDFEDLKAKKDFEDLIKEINKKVKTAVKTPKRNEIEVNFGAEATKVGEKLFQDYKNTLVPLFEQYAKAVSDAIKYVDEAVDAVNRVVTEVKKYGIALQRLPHFEDYMNGEVKEIVKPNAAKEVGKVREILDKLKAKFKGIIERVTKEMNDPSIKTVAVAVAIAIAAYLVLYGVVKSSGGKVSNPAAIKTVLTEAARIIKEGTIAKRLLVFTLVSMFVATVGAAGKVGYEFIKKKLASK